MANTVCNTAIVEQLCLLQAPGSLLWSFTLGLLERDLTRFPRKRPHTNSTPTTSSLPQPTSNFDTLIRPPSSNPLFSHIATHCYGVGHQITLILLAKPINFTGSLSFYGKTRQNAAPGGTNMDVLDWKLAAEHFMLV